MQTPIELIVGLGNPGPQYAKTRHNAGTWFIQQLATSFSVHLKHEAKFGGFCANLEMPSHSCRLLIPSTYMNLSGQSVRALSDFYRIPGKAILVAHDDLDFPPGIVRIKSAGGHGGHKGLSDIIAHLNIKEFYRLRLGIGHPSDRAYVSNYVLNCPSTAEMIQIQDAIDRSLAVFSDISQGRMEKVTQHLHRDSV